MCFHEIDKYIYEYFQYLAAKSSKTSSPIVLCNMHLSSFLMLRPVNELISKWKVCSLTTEEFMSTSANRWPNNAPTIFEVQIYSTLYPYMTVIVLYIFAFRYC